MPSSPAEAIAVVKRFVNEVQTGAKYEVIEEIISPDFVDHTPAQPGANTTRAGLAPTLQYLHAMMEGFHVDIFHCVSDGEVVATNKAFRGKQVGDLFGKPATNAQIEVRVMDFVRVVDGKCTEHWNIVSTIADL